MLNQPIKLTRSVYTNVDGTTTIYNYLINKVTLSGNSRYSLITEDATLIAFSTEAEEGTQTVVGIVKLETGAVVAVALNSIIFC